MVVLKTASQESIATSADIRSTDLGTDMKENEQQQKWLSKAKSFKVFPRRGENKTSDWWLAVFAMSLVSITVSTAIPDHLQNTRARLGISKAPRAKAETTEAREVVE
jgi:hypothetical protein